MKICTSKIRCKGPVSSWRRHKWPSVLGPMDYVCNRCGAKRNTTTRKRDGGIWKQP